MFLFILNKKKNLIPVLTRISSTAAPSSEEIDEMHPDRDLIYTETSTVHVAGNNSSVIIE